LALHIAAAANNVERRGEGLDIERRFVAAVRCAWRDVDGRVRQMGLDYPRQKVEKRHRVGRTRNQMPAVGQDRVREQADWISRETVPQDR
jgi:hypothetical protein